MRPETTDTQPAVSHAALVSIAERWLRGTMGCSVVLTEIGTTGNEIPDAIGWGAAGASILVECKTSRADFHADAAKHFRRNPEMGMGRLRWFLAPAGVIPVASLPEGWGLAETSGKFVSRVKKVVKPERYFEINQTAARCESMLLVSAVKRATQGWGCKVFGDLHDVDADEAGFAGR